MFVFLLFPLQKLSEVAKDEKNYYLYFNIDNGIFFFTPDGNYIEWTGTYIYSDIPFTIENPVVNVGGTVNE